MRTELLSAITVVTLAAGCSAAREQTPEPVRQPPTATQEALPVTPAPDGLPPAVRQAAEAVVSLEVASGVTVYQDAAGEHLGTSVQGPSSHGSAVLVGSGDALTANHVGSSDDKQPFQCFGDKLHGTADGRRYDNDVTAVGSDVGRLGDLALVHSSSVLPNRPTVRLADPGDTAEQQVYMVNYQTTDTHETGTPIVRSPDATDPQWRDPAILSGVAKLDADGVWLVVTSPELSDEYGSGHPARLTGAASGGALLNARGELLGITTAVIDSYKYTGSEVEQLHDTRIDAMSEQRVHWLQYALPVDASIIRQLRAAQQPCAPGDGDRIIRRSDVAGDRRCVSIEDLPEATRGGNTVIRIC